jgi:hypothetical protein
MCDPFRIQRSTAGGAEMTSANKQALTVKKRFTPLTSAEFEQAKLSLRWLVKGILVAKQPVVIGGPKKSLKTSIALDLAISLGTATPFLGKFAVRRRHRVAVFSGESGNATIRETARRICDAKGLSLGDCDVFWDFDLPQLNLAKDRKELRAILKELKIDVVVIDPLYLCLLGSKGSTATNLFEVGRILRRAAKACLDAGATPILIHHAIKGADAKTGMLDLDSLAFAGIGEFARQWILLGRRFPFKPGSGKHELIMTVGGSAGHSGAWKVDVDEGKLQTDFSGRRWQLSVADYQYEMKEDAENKCGKRGITEAEEEARRLIC